MQNNIKENPPDKKTEESGEQQPFVYESDGVLVVFQRMSENYIMKCPYCNVETRYIVRHLIQKDDCTKSIDMHEFQDQFKTFKAEHTNAIKRKVNQNSKTKQRANKQDELKIKQNTWTKKTRAKERAKYEDKVNED